MKRRPRSNSYNDYDPSEPRGTGRNDYNDYDRRSDFTPPDPKPEKKIVSMFNATAIAIIAGIFVLGIGVGIAFTTVTPNQDGVLQTNVQLDQQAPNPDICIQNGASAMSMSTRLYVTLSPFKIYVAQAAMEPACVLRRANWAVLEQRNLLTSDQSRECRQRLSTFGYVGSLENKPTIDCVYQSDNAKNLFLDGSSPTQNNDF
ncbi:DUF3172 domain-containing protein [Myxacorys almedinensis]|uniref:DUF3172 domain-containing protein n=1 Tax=Myxacorys almedinensis A TaxID=2690445 RepID=A0A8J7Z609_9CYAN|nr:DUF3172 domain-containing protein [Myxacorys almedinensis]NDJ18811.1 DUF3172 domain-containing protein [Myxacorys almedinensis A]